MTQKVSEMAVKPVEKITRESLRAMRNGDTIIIKREDAYEMDSQKNTAYAMQKMENCRFACKSDGLQLSVTRYGAS